MGEYEMKKVLLASVSLILLTLPLASLASDDEFVAPEDLKTGQKGYGLTVFKGTEPEKFEVEFVNIASHPFYPKEKAILIRLGSPLQNSNVIAGMSGSPIYFKKQGKWKLAGALAFGYRLTSTGESIAGVTPIHLMLNQKEILGLKEKSNLEPKRLSEPAELTPVKNSDKLKPGDAIALVLANGDYRASAVGTVTYVRGNQFWALGHSALEDGEVTVPIYKVEIATSLKSAEPGLKLSKELKEPMGIITYDNVFGIEGRIQEIPDDLMLPIQLQLTDQKNAKANFSFWVLKNKLYTAGLITNGVINLLRNLWDNGSAASGTSMAIIDFEDRAPIFLNDSMVLGESVNLGFMSITKGPWALASKPVSLVDQLLNSDFNFKINRLQIKINLQPIENTFYLDKLLFVDKNGAATENAHQGEEVNLIISLRSHDSAKKFLMAIPLKIPKELDFKNPDEEKILSIQVASGNHFTDLDESKKLSHPPATPEEFLQTLLINERPIQKIYLQIVYPPTKLSSTPNILPPSLAKEQWHQMETLDFLKTIEATKVKIFTAELTPPIPNFILEVNQTITIKLLPLKSKNSQKKAAPAKKNNKNKKKFFKLF
jgi:hypothetical protein